MSELHDLSYLVTDRCGVYIFLQGDECVYVGQSKSVFKRVTDHIRIGTFVADRLLVQYCEEHELLALEYDTIIKYQPTRNKQCRNPRLPDIKIDLAKLRAKLNPPPSISLVNQPVPSSDG